MQNNRLKARKYYNLIAKQSGNHDCAECAEARFKAGVEFAQQWISCEDELPIAYENGDWTGERSDFVICQLKNDKYCIARLYSGKIDGFQFDDWVDSDDNYLINNVVIAWRPIQLN